MRKDSCFETIWAQLYQSQKDFVLAAEKKIERLCGRLGLEAPILSLGWDANETGADMIRLAVPKVKAHYAEVDKGQPLAAEIDVDETVRHVCAHWLCNLETTSMGDVVADIIAGLLRQVGP